VTKRAPPLGQKSNAASNEPVAHSSQPGNHDEAARLEREGLEQALQLFKLVDLAKGTLEVEAIERFLAAKGPVSPAAVYFLVFFGSESRKVAVSGKGGLARQEKRRRLEELITKDLQAAAAKLPHSLSHSHIAARLAGTEGQIPGQSYTRPESVKTIERLLRQKKIRPA
jgi:hypothetical protein